MCVCNICQPERAAKDVSIDQSSGQPGFGNYRIIIFLFLVAVAPKMEQVISQAGGQ